MDSSTLVLTENLINPDGSRARTKVTLLNGLVSLPWSGLAQEGLETSEVHTPNAVARPAAPGQSRSMCWWQRHYLLGVDLVLD